MKGKTFSRQEKQHHPCLRGEGSYIVSKRKKEKSSKILTRRLLREGFETNLNLLKNEELRRYSQARRVKKSVNPRPGPFRVSGETLHEYKIIGKIRVGREWGVNRDAEGNQRLLSPLKYSWKRKKLDVPVAGRWFKGAPAQSIYAGNGEKLKLQDTVGARGFQMTVEAW